MTVAAFASLVLLIGAWGLLALSTPGIAKQSDLSGSAHAPDYGWLPSARATLTIRHSDGRVWDVPPDVNATADRCGQPVGRGGLNAARPQRHCSYLTCRWLVRMAACLETFTDGPSGNECDEEDYAEIRKTQDAAAALACRPLAQGE